MDSGEKSVRGYDRLASVYRTLEVCLFGNSLDRARVALLDKIPNASRALVMGDGTGRLLEPLLVSQPSCRITSVDQSPEMLKRQRRRVERVQADDRVELIQHDARDYQVPAGEYDLLVAAFFLDCFTEDELASLLPRLLAGLRVDGRFYFVDFVAPSHGWRRRQAAAYQSLMHWFFRWQTNLPNRQPVDLDALLEQQKLILTHSAEGLHPMIACRCYRVV